MSPFTIHSVHKVSKTGVYMCIHAVCINIMFKALVSFVVRISINRNCYNQYLTVFDEVLHEHLGLWKHSETWRKLTKTAIMTDGGEDGKTLGVKYGPPPASAIVREQFKHVKHAYYSAKLYRIQRCLEGKQWDLSELVRGPTGT